MSTNDNLLLSGRLQDLISLLQKDQKAILAFSGGVDSSFLLKAMKLAGLDFLSVTATSETMPAKDLSRAVSFAGKEGVRHITIQTDEMKNEAFTNNTPERCFFCKDELFRKLRAIAAEGGISSVFDGSNSDDVRDFRPGLRAARLHNVRSPLAELNFSKAEIREISRQLGLDTWDQPSSPCLSSRFPYGLQITPERLTRVEKAEEFLRTFGFHNLRVRDHGDTARIEIDEKDMPILMSPDKRPVIAEKLRSLGYSFISLDLEGFRSGSMNKIIEKDKKGAGTASQA